MKGRGDAWHMINPDRTTKRSRDLCYEVRLKENLWGAWNAVRRRALLSRDKETSSDAREFDQNPSKHIRALHEALRHGTFQFAPQRGVLRIKKGKTPRPIVVSPVRNRLVQRAILDVLQSGAPSISKRLGEIPATLATATSVGGIPGRGSPEAVALIRDRISAGATHFIRSDIKNFFTRVPAPKVLAFLHEQSGDARFVEFVKAALAVELSNAEEPKIRDWISLFPTEEVGVPQGSSLSALCANVVLRDFDKALNERGICTVRYIDDFVMLGKSEKSLKLAWATAERILGELGLEAHSPFPGNAKAANGTVQTGFDFLSFKFVGNTVAPSRKAKQDLIAAIRQEVADVRKAIQAAGQEPRRAEPRLVQSLNKIDRRVRGWGDAFKDVDQRLEFFQMDEELRQQIDKLVKWHFNSSKGIPTVAMMRSLGVALLADTPLVAAES
jgi:RNA-directed DNA polymerase